MSSQSSSLLNTEQSLLQYRLLARIPCTWLLPHTLSRRTFSFAACVQRPSRCSMIQEHSMAASAWRKATEQHFTTGDVPPQRSSRCWCDPLPCKPFHYTSPSNAQGLICIHNLKYLQGTEMVFQLTWQLCRDPEKDSPLILSSVNPGKFHLFSEECNWTYSSIVGSRIWPSTFFFSKYMLNRQIVRVLCEEEAPGPKELMSFLKVQI